MVDRDQYLGYFRRVGRSAAALGVLALSCGQTPPGNFRQTNTLENDHFKITKLSAHSYSIYGKGASSLEMAPNLERGLRFISERCKVERTVEFPIVRSSYYKEIIVEEADCITELRGLAQTTTQ